MNPIKRSSLLAAALLLGGCQTAGDTRVLGRDEYFAVVLAGARDTPQTLAERFLGDPARAWMIADANPEFRPGQRVVIPLKAGNRAGVSAAGYQTVPILAYHRFGGRPGKMSLPAETFERQMAYLKENDYRVIPLERLIGFLEGREALPRRAVVITIDDGYRSAYSVAYPILQKYGFPATLFVYSDFIGRGGLDWERLREMEASGLISVQAHSKSHSNLAVAARGENRAAYEQRLEREIDVPTRALAQRLGQMPIAYAFPYGDANEQVLEQLQNHGYRLGLTVQRGGNPAFAHSLLLRRTLIYGDGGMKQFIRALETERPLESR